MTGSVGILIVDVNGLGKTAESNQEDTKDRQGTN
jgi:hypothetical protein